MVPPPKDRRPGVSVSSAGQLAGAISKSVQAAGLFNSPARGFSSVLQHCKKNASVVKLRRARQALTSSPDENRKDHTMAKLSTDALLDAFK